MIKNFLGKLEVVSSMFLTVLIGINVLIDSSKLLKLNYEENILSILNKGNNVSNYDDRKF